MPEKLPWRHYLSLRTQMPVGAKLAKKIITESYHAKEDICQMFDVDPKKIVVIYAGIDQSFKPVNDLQFLNSVQKKYNLPNHFILYVGSFLPHKNLLTLVRAYNILPTWLKNDFRLVLAGHHGWNHENIKKLVIDLGLEKNVIFPGFIAQEDLPFLYKLADTFAFPSLYEGFGLPVLEAMACGTPVVAANSSSIPEVVGDAGMLLSPKDLDAWAYALKRVLTQPELTEKMIAKGLERVSRFDWDETARQTRLVYEALS
jgi:glycosyltransferase involved in cell wall biosynthesis